MTARLARLSLATAIAAGLLAPLAASAQGAAGGIQAFRVGILGGENEADRLRSYQCLVEQLGEALGAPVELYPASDYAGVMQGLVAGQLDMASLGASGYAGIYMQDPNAVEPVFVNLEADGSDGYYAMMYVRADSDIQDLAGMEGRSLAFADPNSTSGYLVPKAELEGQGIDIESYFSRTGFGGGHEQAVIAVLNDQYDAGVTWTSGVGEESEGFTRGNFRTMVENGLLDMSDLRVIWRSNLIPNGPWVIRSALPEEAKTIWTEWMENLPQTDPECFAQISNGSGEGFKRVDHSFFENVVAMREREVAGSR